MDERLLGTVDQIADDVKAMADEPDPERNADRMFDMLKEASKLVRACASNLTR